MKFINIIKDTIRNIDNRSLITYFKNIIIICTICGFIIGLKNLVQINNIVKEIDDVINDENFNINISGNTLNLNNKEKIGFIDNIQYYISDKITLSEANKIKENKISSKDYIIMAKDGIQVNAGIVGMNSYLDSQKQYTDFFKESNVDNNIICSKLNKLKFLVYPVVILESIIYGFCEFLAQISFISIIIYFIMKLIIRKLSFEKVYKVTIYFAFIPKIACTIAQCINSDYKYPQIMLLTFLAIPYIIYRNKEITYFSKNILQI